MKEQGLFVDDHDLLACPQCHLMEDVTSKGLLIVYQRGKAIKDIKRRFIPLDDSNKRFRCPVCNTEINVNELD